MDWTYRLRLRHLQVLLSLASTGNLSQSATALNTTQPALSKWLKELEEDLGLPLFERHARGLRPTSYGEALIEHARRIEAHLDIARDDMQALRAGGSGLVSIGTSGVSAADTVPLAVSRLLERMPRAQVRIVESTMNQLMPQLARGELDIVVGRWVRSTTIRNCRPRRSIRSRSISSHGQTIRLRKRKSPAGTMCWPIRGSSGRRARPCATPWRRRLRQRDARYPITASNRIRRFSISRC